MKELAFPRALFTQVIMFKRSFQTGQHFGGGFQERTEARLVNDDDVCPKMSNELRQLPLDVLTVRGWVG